MAGFLGNLRDKVTGMVGQSGPVGSAAPDAIDPNAPQILMSKDIVKEGWVTKQSRNIKEWRRRYVVLTNDCIATFKQGAAGESYALKDATELIFFNSALAVKSAEQETGKDNAFCVQRTKDGRYFYFVAGSQQDKEEWIGAIGRLMVRRTVIMDPEEECNY
mmetsp:Transcript_41570/g.90602  ORF Transcript_41570/g.90602 Transcript_41570/m.90602 type:complete len:161 (-) Transcript_41570:93-575(-)|eukprot:CAMPEP_0204284848 /NCGR_PEP_ID=MMETSP0468-20130131/49383_1 /ASSEMBLY_ACC=CAM_ASM_000383 /TAXON_ID=2969 /ORGANISM="Oxyrrhis marina" /LENGTH=160 /DNA_ID=CAMNT_0051262619 /DNA_START=29 /DNA_END=511 /DNA_ORIENTATION=-